MQLTKRARLLPFALILLLWWSVNGLLAQSVVLTTWNISNLGKSKSDQELEAMARIISLYDVVTI